MNENEKESANSHEDYQLNDFELPEALEGTLLDKTDYAKMLFTRKVPVEQGRTIWKEYVEKRIKVYNDSVSEQERLDEEFGTKAIPQEVVKHDGLHPTKETCQATIDNIVRDLNHDYYSDDLTVREPVIAYVNRLRAIINGTETSIVGYHADYELEKQERLEGYYGKGALQDKHAAYGGAPIRKEEPLDLSEGQNP